MQLSDDEKSVLDGVKGPAQQKAMELLVKYGEALGAEKLIATNNVCGTMGASTPFIREWGAKSGSIDAVFCEFNLNCQDTIEIPKVEAYTCHLVQGMDPDHWQMQGIDHASYQACVEGHQFCSRIGVQLMNTCTPYLVGNVPTMGEHCAWMESSAVIYCNSVLGARTNAEGRESTGAASLTGKIPYWGYHLDEYRLGSHLIDVDYAVESVMDWGLLGYFVGETVQEHVPVLTGITAGPNLTKIKHFGAAAASSGGVEMYHIVGFTPEAHSLDQAFGRKKPVITVTYDKAARKRAYENINSMAHETQVDFVVLGCPHYSIEQLWELCRLLEGKKIKDSMNLWVFTPRALKELADRNGYTEIIRKAGGVLMTDTCPALGQVLPKGTSVVATDSAKQAHYLPAIMGVQTWFGSTKECVDAAITGRWTGEMK
jgi:predicted aconitase